MLEDMGISRTYPQTRFNLTVFDLTFVVPIEFQDNRTQRRKA